ncbi:unnamed protein product [Caenorhabditis brenneri]
MDKLPTNLHFVPRQLAESLIQMLLDVSFSRIHIYFPQLCPTFAQFLETYWLIPHLIYPLYLYCATIKTVIHSVLSINRATCVTMPTKYGQASLSRFQLTSFVFTFSTNLICCYITLSKMLKLKKRLFLGERHLCIATSWITVGFAIAMIAQAHFAWFRGDQEWAQVFYILQCVSFDLLNLGSPIIMVTISRELRHHVFHISSTSTSSKSNSAKVSTSANNQVITI